MAHLILYQFLCGLFPPVLSQIIRTKIFPLEKARRLGLDFSKTSITGSTFHGNTSDDHSYRFSIHGFYDWRNIIIAHRFAKQYAGDIIEVGANVGTETISFCDLIAPKWTVHAFEPLPDNILSLNNLSQNVQNLLVYPKAVSNKKALVYFQMPPKHESGIGKIINIGNDEISNNILEVETIPLDSCFDVFKNVCLISIDTEGHEPVVLEGANKVINKFRPAIIIEVSPKLLKKYANSSPEKISHFFKERDYLCFTIDRFTLNELGKKSTHSNKSQNWLCIPKEKQHIIKTVKQDLFLRAILPWYLLKSLKAEATQ